MLNGLSLPILLAIFAACAGVIWIADVKLADKGSKPTRNAVLSVPSGPSFDRIMAHVPNILFPTTRSQTIYKSVCRGSALIRFMVAATAS